MGPNSGSDLGAATGGVSRDTTGGRGWDLTNKAGWDKVCWPDAYLRYAVEFAESPDAYAFFRGDFPDKVFFGSEFGSWADGTSIGDAALVIISQNDLKRWRRGIVLHEVIHMVDYRVIYQEMGNPCPFIDCLSWYPGDQPMTEYTAAYVQYKWMGYSDCVARQLAHNYNLYEAYEGTWGDMVTGSIWDLLTSCFHFTVFALLVILALLTGGLLSAASLGSAASVFLLLMVLVSLDKSFG